MSVHPGFGTALVSLTFHSFNEEAVAARCVHPKVVQERLGHSQIGITLDTYSHVVLSLQLEAAGKLDALMRPGKKRVQRRA